MRVLLFVVASGLLAAGGTSSLLAQHSGEHSSESHSSAGRSGSVSGPRSPIDGRSTNFSTLQTRPPSTGQLFYPTPIGLQPTYSGFTGIDRGAIQYGPLHGNDRERNYFGAFIGYPAYYSGFDDYSYPNAYRAQDQAAQAANVNANLLGEQLAGLAAELDELRSERRSYNQPSDMHPRYDDPPSMPEDHALALILKSGKQLRLKSYAVLGQDIWNFDTQPAKRISISSVDLNASRNATEADGGEFPEIR